MISIEGDSIEANEAYSDASFEAKSTPIEFAISKGPFAHLNPTLAPLSTSSIEHISSSTIWEDTQSTVPNKRLLITSDDSCSHSSDPERSHSLPSSTSLRRQSEPVKRSVSSCVAK